MASTGIPAVVLCNKIDLVDRSEEETALGPYEDLGYMVFPMAALEGDGVREFEDFLCDKWAVLLGHSGVGKTTLVNRLVPGLNLAVGEVDEERRKGKHTTTRASGFHLARGGVLVDTAGIREFALFGVGPRELAASFPEIWEASKGCRFPDCRHASEPGCAVRGAAGGGGILPARFANYLKLLDEVLAAGSI